MEIRKHVVLIVDDSPLIIERLISMLEELENVKLILHAGNYNQARAIVTERLPDIVLLDITLPGKSGIELLQFIKADYPHIKVIMLTNQINKHYKKLCLEAGADRFLDKTEDFEQISSIISSM